MAKRNIPHKGFKADIDDATVRRMEAGATSQARGQQRRMVLLACSRDSDTMLKLAKNEPKAFEEMAEMIIEYHAHAKALLDVATAAFARVAMVEEMSRAA